ncbi:hypothetical protein GQ457_12G023930 [Hibiscus cannabinus]
MKSCVCHRNRVAAFCLKIKTLQTSSNRCSNDRYPIGNRHARTMDRVFFFAAKKHGAMMKGSLGDEQKLPFFVVGELLEEIKGEAPPPSARSLIECLCILLNNYSTGLNIKLWRKSDVTETIFPNTWEIFDKKSFIVVDIPL